MRVFVMAVRKTVDCSREGIPISIYETAPYEGRSVISVTNNETAQYAFFINI